MGGNLAKRDVVAEHGVVVERGVIAKRGVVAERAPSGGALFPSNNERPGALSMGG